MKKLLFLIPLILFSQNQIQMPPMPPAMNIEKQNTKPQKNTKNDMPKECKIIPPMLIFMPPPLEEDLIKCKNKLFLPNKDVAQNKLSKKYKNIKIEAISIVEGFNEVYEIKTNKGTFYCNKNVTKCFKVVK